MTWCGLSCPIGAGSFYPPNGSGASFWNIIGVDGTFTLVPTLFSDSVAVVILATVCVEGVMRLLAQSVVNFSIAAVVAAIVVFLLKGHTLILLQQRSEESMKIGLPKKVQRTYEYAIV